MLPGNKVSSCLVRHDGMMGEQVSPATSYAFTIDSVTYLVVI